MIYSVFKLAIQDILAESWNEHKTVSAYLFILSNTKSICLINDNYRLHIQLEDCVRMTENERMR